MKLADNGIAWVGWLENPGDLAPEKAPPHLTLSKCLVCPWSFACFAFSRFTVRDVLLSFMVRAVGLSLFWHSLSNTPRMSGIQQGFWFFVRFVVP